MVRDIYGEEHEFFRDTVRRFYADHVVPHYERWTAEGAIDRDLYRKAGELGLLGLGVPEAYGGTGITDFRFNAILVEEALRAGVGAVGLNFSLHNDICLPYFLEQTDEDQKRRWLPGLVAGTSIAALAMTEPSAGSDVAAIRTVARRDGDQYVINGQKTFISNGFSANLVVVAAKTDPDAGGRGISLFVVEADAPGFGRGRKLDKLGLRAQDTAELYFEDLRVDAADRLGEENHGFGYLTANLAQERLSMALTGVAAARQAVDLTLQYVTEREVFGRPLAALQNTQFVLAECQTEVDVTEAFVDRCLLAHGRGELDVVEAAKAKWWATEMQKRVVDRCLQLFGGYGYILEYPIAHLYADARIATIYGGTTEIMKHIIARDLGLR